METKTKNSSTISNPPKPKPARASSPAYSAQEKAQAILRVWTERCKPADICREMHLKWVTFHQWQQRAMEGMLQGLEPRVNLTKGQALSPRLQTLLANRQRASTRKLVQRLEQIQLANPQADPAKPQ